MSETAVRARGTSNTNVRGNTSDRRRRREWLVQTYRADVDVILDGPEEAERLLDDLMENGVVRVDWNAKQHLWEVPNGKGEPACRCYRCGVLLTVDEVTVDRIFPGCEGGRYGTPYQDAAKRTTNIRPACGLHNSSEGGKLGAARKAAQKGAKRA